MRLRPRPHARQRTLCSTRTLNSHRPRFSAAPRPQHVVREPAHTAMTRRGERCNARLSRQASDAVPMSRRCRPSAPRTGVHLCDLFRPFAFGQQIDEPSASRVTCCRRLLWRARRAHRARRGPTAGRTTTTRRRRTSRPTIAADARAAPAGADGRLNCPLRTRSQDAAPAA